VTRDAQRAKVYAAEGFVRTMFDRAAERGDPVVEFFGTTLTLPPEARFGSVESVQNYVDDVLALPAVRERWPATTPLRVRIRRGATAAHYERLGGQERSDQGNGHGGQERSDPGNRHADAATIAVPQDRSAWALRELVVLHEIAHHLTDTDPAHGPDFVTTFCDLAAAVMGAEVAFVLRMVYAKEGVR
jgi:hypothetical protein